MKPASTDVLCLRDHVAVAPAERFLWDRAAAVRVKDLAWGTSLGGRLPELADRSVLLATASQLTTALALIELDGVVRRLAVLPPGIAPDHLGVLIERAEADAVVIDEDAGDDAAPRLPITLACQPRLGPAEPTALQRRRTEWLLLTSGTSGVPKIVAHSHASLTAPIGAGRLDDDAVWGTFYDIRRYGGLQIYLRAIVGGASLVLSSAGEPTGEHLRRLGRHGVTHLSGTPSHWRKALMSPEIADIAPRYVRLSGEIADQAVLDALRATFPHAGLGHAYASTEAGVVFEVDDGRAGFPVGFVGHDRDGVEIRIVDDALRIRSARTASGYVGAAQPALRDADGFVDTGDVVERRGDRYVFAGRRGGIINVGGLKIHPEEIEAVINRHPQVRMSLVRGKRNAITGAIVIADVVLRTECRQDGGAGRLKDDILALCREVLPQHKVPAAISFVPSLNVAATGKLARRHD